MILNSEISRRKLLTTGCMGMLGAIAPSLLTSGKAYARNGGVWKATFKQAHTGEEFSGTYRVGDKYLPDAFKRISYILRDHRTGEAFPMDPHVLDIMSMLQNRVGGKKFTVLSGYRSPKTNNMLRSSSKGVAKNSYHMYGQALDLRVSGASCSRMCSLAKNLKAGGVGYYPRSNFVHVDTGPIRTW